MIHTLALTMVSQSAYRLWDA